MTQATLQFSSVQKIGLAESKGCRGTKCSKIAIPSPGMLTVDISSLQKPLQNIPTVKSQYTVPYSGTHIALQWMMHNDKLTYIPRNTQQYAKCRASP